MTPVNRNITGMMGLSVSTHAVTVWLTFYVLCASLGIEANPFAMFTMSSLGYTGAMVASCLLVVSVFIYILFVSKFAEEWKNKDFELTLGAAVVTGLMVSDLLWDVVQLLMVR